MKHITATGKVFVIKCVNCNSEYVIVDDIDGDIEAENIKFCVRCGKEF